MEEFKYDPGNMQKCKRRRTSPQDHAVLEAAYKTNSKPGKEERAVIVNQVGLGEKEVQIWFQNRRQNDRRRSKPLQPHELIAHITNSSSPLPLTPDPSQTKSDDATLSDKSHVTQQEQSDFGNPDITPSPSPHSQDITLQTDVDKSQVNDNVVTNVDDATSVKPQEVQTSEAVSPPPAVLDASAGHCSPPRLSTPERNVQSIPRSPGSSARKRSFAEMTEKKELQAESNPPTSAPMAPPKTKEPMKRSSSVRLAVTADGAVKIKTTDELTPSPEKVLPLPPGLTEEGKRRRLSRSISMGHDLGPIKVSKAKGVFGRSRDARKWEFFCDKSAEDELSIQAEAERSGSAVGAINLIRSNSLKGRGLAMSPAPARGNIKTNPAIKPVKPKISRAKSSMARLSSDHGGAKKGGGSLTRHATSPSDSDKENWAPGTQMPENPLRRTGPSRNGRPVLQDNEAVIFPDAAKCCRGAADKLSPRKEKVREDLDCIKGLLSLSQGAWR